MTPNPKPSPPPVDTAGFRRLEHAGWTEVGSAYGDAFGPLTSQATAPLLDAAGVTAGTRLLDVACGPGYVAAAGAARGARATGIDFSSTMVAEARRLHPALEFREGDAEALDLPDAAFDAVTIAFGLLHFARPERALAEARRVLAPGGRLAFSVWDVPERALTFGLILRAIDARGRMDVGLPQGPDFFKYSDPDECRTTLAAAGFRDARVRTVPIGWRVPSSDALLDIALRGGVRTRALLRAQTPAALDAIRLELRRLTKPFERDGALALPAPFVLAAAERA
jgi:SAM-dependent methyltransferase